jgi:hypothetical protein
MGTLAFQGTTWADHDKTCKNVHGKVTVVTEEGISVNDKLYKVDDTTRIRKGDKTVKVRHVSAGDLVCIDTRGKDDAERGVAAVTVLTLAEPAPVVEREFVREKTTRTAGHDKRCQHVHGKVTRINESTLMIGDKPYVTRETTKFINGDKVITVKSLKPGDFVCLDDGDEDAVEHKVMSVRVLSPSDAAPFEEREVLREKIRVREQK